MDILRKCLASLPVQQLSCSETEVSYFHKKKKYSVYPKTERSLFYAINSNCFLPFSRDQRRQRLIKKFMAAAAARERERRRTWNFPGLFRGNCRENLNKTVKTMVYFRERTCTHCVEGFKKRIRTFSLFGPWGDDTLCKKRPGNKGRHFLF